MTSEESKKRYSDEELEEFKQLILEKIEKAQREYDTLLSSVVSEGGNGDGDTSRKFNILEDGSDAFQKEEAQRLAKRQHDFICKLQAALVRIENKTYGICRATGELIPKDRLRAVPHATLTVEAKSK